MPGYECMLLGSRNAESFSSLTTTSSMAMPPKAGICSMTSSAQGFSLIEKVYPAICYLRGWQSGLGISGFALGGSAFITLLIVPNRSVDTRAREWCGKWGDWCIELGDKGELKVRFSDSPVMKLSTAAINPRTYEAEETSINLVVGELDIMMRLGWKDGERVVEVWQDGKMNILE